jgi:cellulose 1,4-beta-cellobiosidase
MQHKYLNRRRAAVLAGVVGAAMLVSFAGAVSAHAAEAHQDNPFVGATQYVNPLWQAEVQSEAATQSDATTKAKMATVAKQPTSVWMDSIGAITGPAGGMGLQAHLDAALTQQQGTTPMVFNVVIYDLPGRDCNALASNGEIPATAAGLTQYETKYIDPIVAILSQAKYASLRIVATIEPDSLPNIVTNSSVAACQTAGPLYEQGTVYALTKLHAISNVYNYLDSAHSGWLGWTSNSGPAAAEFAKVAKATPSGVNSVDGFITDTANTTPLKEPFLSATTTVGGQLVIGASAPNDFYAWNPDLDEATFSADMYPRLVSNGFPASIGMVIDTSRNGWGGSGRPTAASTSTDMGTFLNASKVDKRPHRGAWCNPTGAGLGELPQATPAGYASSHLDAFVWVKPPGESDGSSTAIPNNEGKGFDRMCDPTYVPSGAGWNGHTTGALANAPLSGKWFPAQFDQLVANAYPAVTPATGGNDTTAPSVPTALAVTAKTATTVSLSWSASTDNAGGSGMAGYDVYRGTTKVGSSAGTSFTDTGLTASTAYSYTVQARDVAGNTSASSAAVAVTTSAASSDTTAPSVPANLVASAQSATSVTLAWDASTDNAGGSGVAGYDILRNGTKVGSSTTTGYNDTGLTAATTYTYTVKARDVAGNISAASTALPVTTSPGCSTGGTVGAGFWHTSGNQTVDANNNPVRIAGINWYGFETTDAVVHGLYSVDYKFVINNIKSLGYNTIRIPYSDQMIAQTSAPSSINYSNGQNADLAGLSPIQILDKIITYSGTQGLKIILDHHRSEAGNSAEDNGLWFTSQYPESVFIANWKLLANRYKANTTVIGYDLHNEPHTGTDGNYANGATWGTGTATDWRLAAERAGNAILAINPQALIMVEGIGQHPDATGKLVGTWWGGDLSQAGSAPVRLTVANHLVYSPHDYGPDLYQQVWFNSSTTAASLASVWDQNWGYLSNQGTAPVWVGEFGTTNNDAAVNSSTAGSQGQWFSSLFSYLRSKPQMGFTYWAYNGEDSYGLAPNSYASGVANAAKQAMLATDQFPLGGTGGGSCSDTTAPSTPGALTVTGTTSSTATLSWNASTDNVAVTGYDVYRGSTLAGTVTGTTFTDTGLNASTAYSYTVKAHDAAGNQSAASAAVTATTTPGTGTGTTTCDPQGTMSINGGEYTLQANEWNSTAQQCITATTGTAWSLSTANFNLPTNGAPATYPSLYKGCHWGACTTNSNLPIQVSKLGSATSSWSTVQPAAGAYDVAYDVWINSTPTTSGQPDGTEIMIWLNSRGGVSPFGSKTATATIDGRTYDVWTGQQTGWKIISYVLQTGTTSVSNLNVKSLIDDSVARGSTNANHYIIDAEAGFEVWQGGQGLATNSFSFNATTGTSTDTTPPSTPNGLAVTGTTSTTASLSWNASTDNVAVTGYDVYRGSTLAGTVTGTTFLDTGLTPSTAYSYTVKAHDAAGNQSAASAAVTATTTAGGSTGTLLTQGHNAWASSSENGSYPASNAVDGNAGTRWSSAFQDNQWINIDLGADHHITQVVLNWEGAYASSYKVQVSEDPNFGTWTDLNTTTNGTGGINTLTVNGTGRYLRVLGQTRATPYGISLFEIQGYGQ